MLRARIAIAIIAVVSLTSCARQQAQTASAPPPVPVAVASATEESIPFELRVVGTVEASAMVHVKSQVGGALLGAHFTEGQNVEKDALLFEVDARPYREALRQAEAALARDRAQIKQAEATVARDLAQLKNADADAARYAELSKAGVISKAQYDQVRTTADVYRESARAAEATADTARAAIESDLAAIERAKLDMAYCEIRAPIAGRTGNLLVHPGNLVRANGDEALVVIHRVAPIFVRFGVPEQHLPAIRRESARRQLSVRVSPQGEPGRDVTGRLTVIDNTVDSATGTIHLKAEFPNSNGMLWPGQFVDAALTLDTVAGATVVPAEAVQPGVEGQFVYVVKSGKVEPRVVTTGRMVERKIVIEKGVAPGETVVTDGHMRLFPGATVKPTELGQP